MVKKKVNALSIFWMCVIFFLIGGFRMLSFGDASLRPISSDGRGYYAYLPALFLQQDPSFMSTLEAENDYYHFDSQHYIIESAEDRQAATFNKCFPGIAVLQSPFFSVACLIEFARGKTVTGYSATFTYFFYLGQLFYALLGFVFFVKSMELLFPNVKYLPFISALFFIATPLLFYSLEATLAHGYTFFLYGWLSLLILKNGFDFNAKYLFLLGAILGLIALTRPTNLIIVFMIPFLLGSLDNSKQFFQALFKNKAKYFFIAFLSFLMVCSIQLFIWKWQSGSWFFWAYNGEGFNWGEPKIWQLLFSFRTGLFLHTPLLIFSFIGIYFMWKISKFKTALWLLYFTMNTYIISSWWCWDYETPFGVRPFTEHLFFLLIPLFYLLEWKPKLMLGIITCFSILGLIRYTEFTSGFMTNQRFTSDNYFKSLQFWKPWNYDRWAFTDACKPYGKVVFEQLIVDDSSIQYIDGNSEFIASSEVKLSDYHLDSRYFVTVEISKNLLSESWESTFLVLDASSSMSHKRWYSAMPLYNDKLEAKDDWKKIVISEAILDNFSEYDQLKIYIWNPGKQVFQINHLKILLQQYKAN